MAWSLIIWLTALPGGNTLLWGDGAGKGLQSSGLKRVEVGPGGLKVEEVLCNYLREFFRCPIGNAQSVRVQISIPLPHAVTLLKR
ncbi:hypothetical protein BT63DRAFT_423924 [Microthyrium microscopicum]|uniref:Secreted protein n=1 Tax=Microthyrium microscopicum TaxID=703497 RepID=A0A6A6UFT2_9PEZI|nr:hypothetical protein BT63DRAFT_423924 [Microthyrium microscopicum]